MWESFKKSVGGALFDEETPKPAEQLQQPAQQAPVRPGPTAAPYVAQPIGLNQAMVDAIRSATMARNTALTALIKAGDELKDFIPDPVMRLKAAYKTAGGGRKPQDIADAVSIHLNDVNAEEGRFANALNQKMKSEVQTLVQQADAARDSVARKTDEIGQLTARIQQLQQELHDESGNEQHLRSEAAQKEAEFQTSAEEFKAAAEAVRAELNTHKTAILSTLQ